MRKSGLMAILLTLAACQQPSETPVAKEIVAESLENSGWTAKSLPELTSALEAGEVTSETLVQAYLNRIERIDRKGPTLRSVIALNPDALAIAREIDARRAKGEAIGALQGVPILLKDNIETADKMPTTAGAMALLENYAAEDAPVAAGIRAQDGIILGKTNLSQWANFRSNNSISGWSAVGGQVRNPHVLDRSPCGSSSGSGAATAAGLAAGSVGTETNGSIICPSNVNGIVGFKPTLHLTSQDGIIPISSTQDTAGPMTRTVKGAAILLGAMSGADDPLMYAKALDDTALKGAKVGVLRFSLNSDENVTARFDAALDVLRSQGAELVEITEFTPASATVRESEGKVLMLEFKTLLDAYLSKTSDAVPVKSLGELIAYNEAHADRELALFGQDVFVEAEESSGMADPDYPAAVRDVTETSRANGIDALMAQYGVDVLVSPSGPVATQTDPVRGDVWGSWAGFGYAAAFAGYPHLSVPAGDVHGIPLGVSFFGSAGDDAEILSYGYDFEQASQMRVEPEFLSTAEERPEIAAAVKWLQK